MPRSFEENLALYAQLAIREGVGLRKGQELLLACETGDAQFARLLVAEAYRAGAKHVEVLWSDPGVTLARFEEGSDEAIAYVPGWLVDGITRAHREGAARLGVVSSDPGLLAGIAPDRVATSMRAMSAAKKEMSELITGFDINWCIIGAASEGWAAKVFGDRAGVERLWEAIFLTSRVLEPDPIAAWTKHCESLESRVDLMNELRLDALHFRGPGTDLKVGLVEGHLWAGGRGVAKNGIKCSPNIPTEEVFTMPHRARVDGTVRSTMAMSMRGQIVDGISVTFNDGVAVSYSAERGQETLERLLSSDEGAKRLGEVALVPARSKVAQAGILFYNTLYDENAASHIAFGACYSENIEGEVSEARGANDSIIHSDWMIGSASMDVDGILPGGETRPLMRAGEWV